MEQESNIDDIDPQVRFFTDNPMLFYSENESEEETDDAWAEAGMHQEEQR